MAKTPKVSVVTITYNHERYIRRTFDSFVEQQTDFDFEVIVADDGSIDGTAAIVREYETRFPMLFKSILRKKNIGAQNNFKDAILKAEGEYIALCEGDDFWLDSSKLQRQVNFLDSHPDYSICFHPVKVFYDKSEEETIFPEVKDLRQFTTKRLLEQNFIQTNSVMYRRMNYEALPTDILPLDWFLHLLHAKTGKIGFINRVMAAYRRHEEGLWWGSSTKPDEIYKKYGLAHAALYRELLKLYDDSSSRQIIKKNIVRLINSFSDVDKRRKTELVYSAVKAYPRYGLYYINSLKDNVEEGNEELQKLNQYFRGRIISLEVQNKKLEKEIEDIKASRIWKLRNQLVKLIRRR